MVILTDAFSFDNEGQFIPSEYIVGMLAEVFLNKEKGATIIHDPRVILNTNDIINTFGGNAVASKTGHAFVKLRCEHKMLFMVVKCQLTITLEILIIVTVE